MNKNISSINKVVFTNAPDGSETDAQVSTASTYLESATITTRATTTDTNISVMTTEVKTDPAPGVDPSFSFTTVISTVDPDVVIETNGIVSAPTVQVITTGTDYIDDKGLLITTIYTNVVMPGSTFSVYGGTTLTGLVDALPEVPCRYIICRQDIITQFLHGNAGGDPLMLCEDMFSMMNIGCIKISEPLYQTAGAIWQREKVIEIDKDTAYWGTTLFGEIRPIAKVWEAKTRWYGEKIPTEVTPDIQEKIITVMKSFAYEFINMEYDRKYLAMRNTTELEMASWQVQKEEAKEWLEMQGQNGSVTPFLDYLATEQGLDKTELANKILQKSQEWQDNLSTMLTNMQVLTKKFKNCTTVWDLNTLYEDYFGVSMPVRQAIELGRTISDTDWNRKPEWRVKGNGYYF